ncbi:MAG: histidine--tRNA ligase [Candidatus Hydrogenedentes bacterium]|nr:histidine--tRNA ligase [Candidatus Hydrogenedentota bacterium]
MSSVVYSPAPISGFPEWLPEVRLIEQQWLDEIRRTFESYGFCSVETPSVEDLRALLAKGETDKEIYTLTRLQADENEKGDARLGLHYDLTVPLARYVAQHYNNLVFPFKRYQIQRVWRGERPQEGRFREFYQCDIDVINNDSVPLYFDAEMPAIVHGVLSRLGVGACTIGLSNRKILQGFYSGLGIDDIAGAIRVADKLDKIGPVGVSRQLQDMQGISESTAKQCLALAAIRTADASFAEKVRALGITNSTLEEGLSELTYVIDNLLANGVDRLVADMSIARGFDYYTGSVYEGRLDEYPKLGAVFSGGRYDNLAGSYIRKNLPGVGISIGLTRLFSKLVAEGRISSTRKCPTDVLVIVPNDAQQPIAAQTAHELRERGYKVELYHAAEKLQKQLRYASRKAIPFVWFPPFEDGSPHEVKNMASGDQQQCDPQTWSA